VRQTFWLKAKTAFFISYFKCKSSKNCSTAKSLPLHEVTTDPETSKKVERPISRYFRRK